MIEGAGSLLARRDEVYGVVGEGCSLAVLTAIVMTNPPHSVNTFERLFRWSAALLLLSTAAAKLISAGGRAAILDFPDPLLALHNRQLLVLVALIEVIIGAALLSRLSVQTKYLLVAWLSSNFILYRLGLHVLSPGKPCPCLGTITERLHLNPDHVNTVLWAVALYLLAGSVGILTSGRRGAHIPLEPSEEPGALAVSQGEP